MSTLAPTLFYDGDCGLCHWAVQFLQARDTKGRIHFAPLQSELAHRHLPPAVFQQTDFDTVYFVQKGRHCIKSAAILQALSYTTWKPIAVVARIIPRFIRDLIYDWVAARRKDISCRIHR